jgi:hypothetical protein
MISRLSAFFIGVLLALPVLPADNSITLQEQTGAAQSNLPVTVMAVIARGEIPGFARPAITVLDKDGNEMAPRFVPAQWQSDVKTRWRDALATFKIQSVANPESKVCEPLPEPCTTSPYVRVGTNEPHGFRDGERVSIAGSESAELNGIWTVVDRTDTSFALAGVATVANPGGKGGEATGLANGSWATGLVTVFIPEMPANSRVRIDFIQDEQPSHDPASRGLSREDLAARTWDAVLDVASPAKAGQKLLHSVSAREILSSAPAGDCGVRAWLAGPLVTEYLIEDNCMAASPAFDFGWMPVAPLKPTAPVPATQSDGTQIISVGDASGITASDEAPALINYMSKGSYLNSAYASEYINICGVTGAELRVCPNGRGQFDTPLRAIPAGALIGVLQGKDASDAYRNFHPWFMVRAYTGNDGAPWPGVRIRYALSNVNPHKLGTGYVAVTMRSSNGEFRWKSGVQPSAYASDAALYYLHQAGAEISKVFWENADPEHYCDGGQGMDPCTGGTRARKWLLDPNLDYKVYAGFVLPFDGARLNPGAKPFTDDFALFAAGDRGEPASVVSKQGGAHVNYKNYTHSVRVLGYSFYSAQAGRRWAGGSDNDREEGWIWSRALARTLPVLGSEPKAWEILFGTSLPGGAGLQAAEHHLPMNWMEGSPLIGARPFSLSTCPSCTAYGRPVSIDVRPTLYVLKSTSEPSQTANERMNYAGWGVYNAELWYQFQAPGLFYVGDQNLDTAHRQPHSPYLYLVTGDYYDLRQTQNWAAWILTFKNPGTATLNLKSLIGSAMRHLNWGVQVTPSGHVRAAAWSILTVGWASALSPNVPQFGNSYLPPERYYYESKLAKTFQSWEGMTGMTDGWFPPANPSCADIEVSAATRGITTATTNDPWCWGRQDMGRNRPMPLSITVRPDIVEPDIDKVTMNPAVAGGGQTPFNLAQLGISLWQVNRLGIDMAAPIFHRHGRMLTNLFVNSQTNNPYEIIRYRFPWITTNTTLTYEGLDGTETLEPHSYFPSWGALRMGFQPAVAKLTTWEGPNRILNEYGYGHYFRATLSAWKGIGAADTTTPGCREKEKGPAGCTADAAYDSVASVLPQQDQYANAKRTAQMPAETIVVQAVNVRSTEALIAYTTSSRNACRYYAGATAPASSLQWKEPSDNGKQPRRELRLASLQPDTLYHLRLTCGRARTAFTFMTEASRNAVVSSSERAASALPDR